MDGGVIVDINCIREKLKRNQKTTSPRADKGARVILQRSREEVEKEELRKNG